ncbi:hypothetical protein G4G27_22220 [Sphingomonas sp. So64.6b]|uniref:hypothetical protein n=1 Tax=Sphingomonas sp. So64.6b TaxID=2997354 RepID=UPI0015FF609C|nr:hypothetical protein [Sphingomonas sp. So64.6b]QNA86392.1 hypothetical protein G4G27_22220 [Sphingomonas sp. So64.6b]
MSADARRQAAMLVRLREVRMNSAASALAVARAETLRAEQARAHADAASIDAEGAYRQSRDRLADDPNEAERLLAVVDRMRFAQSVARSALNDAREAERLCVAAETARRKTMIIARARHDILAERAAAARRAVARANEDRSAEEVDESRRMR